MFRHEKVFAMERNCIVGQKSYNKPFLSSRIRNFVTPIIESVHNCANHTVPYGTALLGWRCPRHFVPGYDRTVPPGHSQQALAGCCCQMSASASRRDNTDRSQARSAWNSVPRKNRPVGYGMIGCS